jgi:hypothetical protein
MRYFAITVLMALATPAAAGPLWGVVPAIREELEHNKDRATAACARSATVPRTVTLRLRAAKTTWPHRGVLDITAVRDDDFSICFAREQSQRHTIVGEVPKPISSVVTLSLRQPKQILAGEIAYVLGEESICLPRPGAIPRSVVIDVFMDDGNVATRALTTPSNPAVDTCIADELLHWLHDRAIGDGAWKPEAHVTRKLQPVVTPARLRKEVAYLAREAAMSCIDELPSPRPKMKVTVTAKRDADDFGIVARSGDETRDTCTVAALTETLHEFLERELADGTHSLRIDGDATVSLTFAIETWETLQDRPNPRDARMWNRLLR